ncbi:MAG: hypothetical protein QXN55_01405 [Candidatus Nitrosotenuis sp.]
MIEQETDMLYFSWSICHDHENFSYKIGQNVVKGKMFNNKTLSTHYNRKWSLVENALVFLNTLSQHSDKRQLLNKLKKILKQNDAETAKRNNLFNKMKERFDSQDIKDEAFKDEDTKW